MKRRASQLRSSPRKRGPRATERGPWIPACAGMNGMERRAFLALLAAAAAWPLAARAQQEARIPRIAILAPGRSEGFDAGRATHDAVVTGLRQLGDRHATTDVIAHY